MCVCKSIPMPCSLPNNSQHPQKHQHIKEALQHNSQILQIIPVHIHTRYTTSNSTSSREQHPIPLPSPPRQSKPPILSQKLLPMLLQIDQCKHYRDGKYRRESYAQFPALGDALDGYVAGSCVYPGAVAQDDGFPLVEDEVAF